MNEIFAERKIGEMTKRENGAADSTTPTHVSLSTAMMMTANAAVHVINLRNL